MHDRPRPTMSEHVAVILWPHMRRAGLSWADFGYTLGSDMSVDALQDMTNRFGLNILDVVSEAVQTPSLDILNDLDEMYDAAIDSRPAVDVSLNAPNLRAARRPPRRGPMRIKSRDAGT